MLSRVFLNILRHSVFDKLEILLLIFLCFTNKNGRVSLLQSLNGGIGELRIPFAALDPGETLDSPVLCSEHQIATALSSGETVIYPQKFIAGDDNTVFLLRKQEAIGKAHGVTKGNQFAGFHFHDSLL